MIENINQLSQKNVIGKFVNQKNILDFKVR